jgi:hypothetical protein
MAVCAVYVHMAVCAVYVHVAVCAVYVHMAVCAVYVHVAVCAVYLRSQGKHKERKKENIPPCPNFDSKHRNIRGVG